MENLGCVQLDEDTKYKSFILAEDMAAPERSTFEMNDIKSQRKSRVKCWHMVLSVYLTLLTAGVVYLVYRDIRLHQEFTAFTAGFCHRKCPDNAGSNDAFIGGREEWNPVVEETHERNLSSERLRDLEGQIRLIQSKNMELTLRLNNITLFTGESGIYRKPGERGPPGIPGSKGEKGDAGLPGPKGGEGSSSKVGPPGPQGPPGQNGMKGEPGQPGQDGQKGAVGAPGVPGLLGLPGVSGEKGNKGDIGLPGMPGVLGNPGTDGQRGQKGDTGLPGNKGDEGSSGKVGTPGLPGIQGPPGRTGQNGTTGEPGQPGQDGQKGAVGAPGVPGLHGLPGVSGEKGNNGDIGLPGTPGAAGNPGTNGQRGQKGDTGARGDVGHKGDRGIPGAAGIPGSTGTTGNPGPPGPKGQTGEKGATGPQGPAGIPGQNRGSDIVRIVGGLKGRVEIKRNGEWGTICDDSWDNNDGIVICRMLGHSNFVSVFTAAAGTGKIFLDEVACKGTERSILDCEKSDWEKHNCNHAEDAGVECA